MVNPFKEVNWRPDTAARRTFARSLVIGFPCVGAFLVLAGRVASGAWHPQPGLYVGGIGAAVGLVLWAFPALARPFYVAWYALACSIGLVAGNLLLGAMYYVFMTTTGLLLRALGRDSVRKTLDRAAPTYWRDARQPDDPRRYFRQY